MADNLRFSLQFDKNDPDSLEAAEFLNQFGRSKSKIVVKALIAYKRCNQGTVSVDSSAPASSNTIPGISYEQIKAVVAEVLKEQSRAKAVTLPVANIPREKDVGKSEPKQVVAAEVAPVVSEPDVMSEHSVVSDDSIPALSDEILSTIQTSLNMFGEG